jgi:hypothetical protein
MFGLVNASLYAALLPLWEGFDEAFHYGYIESLWQTHQLPALGRTLVPIDVFRSFRLAPVSHIVNRWFPETISFETWFSLPRGEKEKRRLELDMLHPEPDSGPRPNYEAHHPPLAYTLLAVPDWLLLKAAITTRVLVLRLFAAVCSTVLLYFGAIALCRTLGVPERFTNFVLFIIFCSQMLYATIAHVANDWLAVGVGTFFFTALANFYKKPDRRRAVNAGTWLAAGLLTKAYFLVFGALALGVTALLVGRHHVRTKTVLPGALLVLALAGPWYARNLAHYGNLSGTLEEFEGVGVRQTLAAATRIDWASTASFQARGSLWTGNNSFTTFSKSTLNLVLGLVFLAFAAWGLNRSAIQSGERIVFAGIVLFSAAVAYASCAAFADKNGEVPGASPWYTQVLLAPLMALATLGMSRWKGLGRALAICTTAVWTWILVATWTVKLFPMYSGGRTAPVHLNDVKEWYVHGAAAHASDLSLLALAPAPVLYGGLLISVVLSICLSAAVIRSISSPPALQMPTDMKR